MRSVRTAARHISFSITRRARRLCPNAFAVLCACAITAGAFAGDANAEAPTLTAAVIQDSEIFQPGELFAAYRTHLGRPVTERTAAAIADAVRAMYQQQGYARPGYKILDGGEQSGIVRIRIVEVRISRVDWSGSAGPFEDELRSMAGALPMQSSIRPAAIRELLRRARRIPGVTVEADTRVDPEGKGIVLDLDSRYRPFEGRLKLSNRGTREIGRNLAFGQVAANGLFGRENQLGLYAGTSEEGDAYRSGGLFATAALGSGGASARLVAGVSALRLDGVSGLEEHDRSLARLRFTHSLRRGDDSSLSAWGAFELEDLDIAINGIVLREDRLRSVLAGAGRGWKRGDVQYYASLEAEQGITGLGGGVHTVNNPDDPRRPDFAIARVRLARLAALGEDWSLRWDAYAQYSPHLLPSTKRFKVGGNRIGRGFEAAAISGDRGVGNTLRLDRRLNEFSDWRGNSAFFAFYDLGTTWREDRPDRASAASAGFGVSFRADWLSGRIELAKPLTHADEDGNRDTRLFAEITMEF